MRPPRVLDLFCGAGGLSAGFSAAGYHVVGGIDNWDVAVDTFQRSIPEARGLVQDLRASSLSDIRDLVGSGVDVVIGGPACQGFSTSGGLSRDAGRNESDPRNRLFTNYLELVDLLRPAWIVFENVPGLLLYDQGRVALEIVRAFREIGYSLVPVILLAADFGVPQLRRRLVFVGNRTQADIVLPVPTHGNPDLWKNYALPFAHLSRIGHGSGETAAPHVSFGEACGDLPELSEGESIDGVPYNSPPLNAYQELAREGCGLLHQHTSAKLSQLDRAAAATLKPGENWRSLSPDILPDRFKRIRAYDATTLLRRLRVDQPAYTITTKFNEGTTGAFIHPTQARTLSLREAARLQSFPDRFVFSGSSSQIRQQIGNAVPPMLATAIAEAILPAVSMDCYGENRVSTRDVVAIQNGIRDEEILRLRAARRLGQTEHLTVVET